MSRAIDLAEKVRIALVVGFLLVVLQFAVGWFLSLSYDPQLGTAHASVLELRSGAATSFLARFHYWGSAALILVSLGVVCAMAWSGAAANAKKLYVCALAIFGLALAMQVTGNLLPLEAHDVQTVVVEAGIASRMPGGSFAAQQMLQGESFGQPTLAAWLLAHKWLLAVPLLAFALWGFRLLMPSRKQLGLGLAVCVFLAVVAAFVPGPTGEPSTASDFNKFDARPSWYTWPLHGALSASESISPGLTWVGVGLVPALAGALLLAMPWIIRRSQAGARLSLLGLGLVFAIFAVGFGGSFAPVSGPQSVVVTPEKDWGPAEPLDESIAKFGRTLFSEKGCDSCHGIDGSQPNGGPDLTRVHEKYPARAFYLEFIPDPKSVRPSTTMPAFGHLSKEEIEALAEFLRTPR